MNASLFSWIFLGGVAASLGLRIWLAIRHMHHVAAHRDAVPTRFSESIGLDAHRKAADYTLARMRFGLVELAIGTAMLMTFTFGGFLQTAEALCAGFLAGSPYLHGLALFGCVALAGFVVELPLDLYRNFVLEERFGFNRMTLRTFVIDLLKQGMIAIVIGAPLLLAVLWLMHAMGAHWWLYVWLFWLVFNLLMLVLYPTLIAPLFNKFIPLDDPALRTRIEALLSRCGFRSGGLFVMDGSKRSAHGNAYFTGFGATKRIVFFDTLLTRLTGPEVEAVLAHELGHFKLNHVIKRIAVMFLVSLGFLALLGFLKTQAWFYTGLGVTPLLEGSNDAMALILFMFALPVFTFLLSPLLSITSRKNEFEADAFAAKHSNSQDLISALVKLYEDNASTLTPDPLHSAFYDSHPPASVRVQRLLSA